MAMYIYSKILLCFAFYKKKSYKIKPETLQIPSKSVTHFSTRQLFYNI